MIWWLEVPYFRSSYAALFKSLLQCMTPRVQNHVGRVILKDQVCTNHDPWTCVTNQDLLGYMVNS